ncbi:hypothetical protein [Streptomyces sp. 891-h]|uniref:hypothetical protein n=1 Tax=unclassified Streptomyces TaxID=2593676 RepID=UPI001FA99D4C|nr:hypothetical protein [Streptomyces sp. 891-h]UNZ16696.1 hypothetical protein HC362_06050 [Streptomyces sp. 891-h]
MSEGEGMDPGPVLFAAAVAHKARTDYDWTTLRAQPSEMDLLATKLEWLADQIAGRIRHINEILNNLQLQWQGESATEQKDISDRWSRVYSNLFGTEESPETGVLNAITGGVKKAASNFGQAENEAWKMFNKYHTSLTAPSPMDQIVAGAMVLSAPDPEVYKDLLDQMNSSPQDRMDTDHTAVTADYPGDDGISLRPTEHAEGGG